MNKEELLLIINEMCQDIFDLENLSIKYSSSPNDIDEWDSLNHLNLISSIETEFKIKFTFNEISSFKNIDSIIKTIQKKI